MPRPSQDELERRIREALRQVAEEADQTYDLKLSEAERAERLRKAEKAFLEGGIEIAGELKTPVLSATLKLSISRGTSVARLAVVAAAMLIGLAMLIGGVYLLMTLANPGHP